MAQDAQDAKLMTNPFQAAVSAAHEALEAFAGQEVTYRRGETVVPLPAVVSRKEYRLREQQGVVTAVESWDFIVLAADLGLTPRRGDLIDATIGTELRRCAVSAPDGEHHYRACDSNETKLRIHTTLTGPVEA